MVDALRSAWTVLRPRGLVIDVRPAAAYRARVAVRHGARRIDVGPARRDPDPDIVAAQRAVQRTVRQGWFDVIARERVPWRSRYEDLAALDRMLAANENWGLPPATRRRLARVLTTGDVIEVSRVFSLAILRKRSGALSGQPTPIR
jgi:hypothetical protein